jgi:hypothetical protein
MDEDRKKRFVTPGEAWTIVEGPGQGKSLKQLATEKSERESSDIFEDSQNSQLGEKEARAFIRFWMRQMDGGYYPTRLNIKKDSKLVKMVDDATAQKIYNEEIDRIEQTTNVKLPRWDSDNNMPVPGTPKP